MSLVVDDTTLDYWASFVGADSLASQVSVSFLRSVCAELLRRRREAAAINGKPHAPEAAKGEVPATDTEGRPLHDETLTYLDELAGVPPFHGVTVGGRTLKRLVGEIRSLRSWAADSAWVGTSALASANALRAKAEHLAGRLYDAHAAIDRLNDDVKQLSAQLRDAKLAASRADESAKDNARRALDLADERDALMARVAGAERNAERFRAGKRLGLTGAPTPSDADPWFTDGWRAGSYSVAFALLADIELSNERAKAGVKA